MPLTSASYTRPGLILRLPDRFHWKLDSAIRRFALPFAAWRGFSIPDAPGGPASLSALARPRRSAFSG
jgi:hypothetical protein